MDIEDQEEYAVSLWILPWPDGDAVMPIRPFISEHSIGIPSFDWMPDSRHLIVCPQRGTETHRLYLADIRTSRLIPLNLNQMVEQYPSIHSSQQGIDILFSRGQRDYNIVEVPVDGSPPHIVYSSSRWEFSPSLNSAGTILAYASGRNGTIWIQDLNSGAKRRVVSIEDFPADEQITDIRSPVMISPDGTKVAFRVRGSTGIKVWIASTEIAGPPAKALPDEIHTSNTAAASFSWSPDSKSLVLIAELVSDTMSEEELNWVTVRIGEPESYQVIDKTNNLLMPLWSPDDKWIAAGRGKQIELIPLDKQSERKVLNSPFTTSAHGHALIWSRDGSEIYVASSNPGERGLCAVNVENGSIRYISHSLGDIHLRSTTTYTLFGSMTSTGSSFLTTSIHETSDLYILRNYPFPLQLGR
jgi:Tol biopolymer transport system component